ncbi:MAG: ABC transporter ATP-binding protein [Corynebacterium sp.]|nr:ABC transporter ATP-binding protein [Corynebacterium sp.]
MSTSISLTLPSWTYPGTTSPSLKNIELQIPAGQRVLLMGPSGSGKSTLLAALTGQFRQSYGADQSTVLDYGLHDPVIGMVLQDPEAQVIYSRVGEDIAFGLENTGVEQGEMWRRVAEAKTVVGMGAVDDDHPTEKLSGGQKQRMAVAGVIAMRPDIMIFDEPTANIDPNGVEALVTAIGNAIEHTEATSIIVDHNAENWVELVDRIIVMSNGEIVYDMVPAELTTTYRTAVEELGMWLPNSQTEDLGLRPILNSEGGEVLRAEKLAWGWENILGSTDDESYRAGSSYLIRGENGTGKTTKAMTLAGLIKPLAGRLTPDVSTMKSRELARKVGYVFQDPNHQFLTSTVEKELSLGAVVGKQEITQILEELGLAQYTNRHPAMLSGGEKRRLSVATALVRKPEVIILDEPTFGLDRANFIALARLLQKAQADGSALISITHDPHYTKIFGGTDA